ncbi:MAG: hypothetical protein ACREXX_00570 [Gammaproteobacteria bacterium]
MNATAATPSAAAPAINTSARSITSEPGSFRCVSSGNSAWPEERTLGARWRIHYDRDLATTATEAAITRPEGQAFLFKLVGGVWTPEVDVTERLERLTDTAGQLIGWRYTTNNARRDPPSDIGRSGDAPTSKQA